MKFGYAPPKPDVTQQEAELLRLEAAGCAVLVTEDEYSDTVDTFAAFVRCLFQLRPADELLVSDYRGIDVPLFIGHLNALRARGVHFSTFDERGQVEAIDGWIQAQAEARARVFGKDIRPAKKFGYAFHDPKDHHFDLDLYQLHELGCDPVIVEKITCQPAARSALVDCVQQMQAADEMIFLSGELVQIEQAYEALYAAIRRGVAFYAVYDGEPAPFNHAILAMGMTAPVVRVDKPSPE